MYKFQEVLFGAEERPSEEAPKEERIADGTEVPSRRAGSLR